jgi:hypothetical protein
MHALPLVARGTREVERLQVYEAALLEWHFTAQDLLALARPLGKA